MKLAHQEGVQDLTLTIKLLTFNQTTLRKKMLSVISKKALVN
ncbi:hypothetical protein N1I87_09290 [Bacillus sp. FSL W8-0102]